MPLVRCDDQVFNTNRLIKQEIIEKTDHNNDHVFNRVIKQEFFDETDYNDDHLRIG